MMTLKSLLITAGILIAINTSVKSESKVYTVTAYCSCKRCCGPNAFGITASGKPAKEGITIAAPRHIPFGTRLNIQGLGIRTVSDRLALRYNNRIDVYFNSHNQAKQFGIKKLVVKRV
jgi:3D (Asp-Asp-Asp) domain-containing protein